VVQSQRRCRSRIDIASGRPLVRRDDHDTKRSLAKDTAAGVVASSTTPTSRPGLPHDVASASAAIAASPVHSAERRTQARRSARSSARVKARKPPSRPNPRPTDTMRTKPPAATSYTDAAPTTSAVTETQATR
jgi:hypothetical protein